MHPLRRQQVMLLLSLAAMCSLVQFPFSAPVYFLYIAPLARARGGGFLFSPDGMASPDIGGGQWSDSIFSLLCCG